MANPKCCLCWNKLKNFKDINFVFRYSRQNLTTCKKYLQDSISTDSDFQYEEDNVPICANCYSKSKELIRLHDALENLQKQLNEYVIVYNEELLRSRSLLCPSDDLEEIKKEDTSEFILPPEEFSNNYVSTFDDIQPKDEIPESPVWHYNESDESSSELNGENLLGIEEYNNGDHSKTRTINHKQLAQELRVQVQRLTNSEITSKAKPSVVPAVRPTRKAVLIPRKCTDDEEEFSTSSEEDELQSGDSDEYIPPSAKNSNKKSKLNDGEDDDVEEEPNKVLHCKYCEEVLVGRVALKAHLKTHDAGERNFQCSLCQERFKLRSQLKYHNFLVHNNDRPFECKYCGRAFATTTYLNDHMVMHNEIREKKFMCDECGKRFSRRQGLQCHKQLHKPDGKRFRCTLCPKAFISQHSLGSHMLIHTGERPFVCQLCGVRYRYSNQINKHMKISHGDNPYGEAFQCNICGKRMKHQESLQSHVKVQHSDTLPISCTLCDRRFRTNRALGKHMTTHNPELKFTCPTCDTRYASKEQLRNHVKSHRKLSGEKTHECPQCGKMFYTNCNLKAHSKCHISEKPFECEKCGKGFRIKSRLTRHQNMKVDCTTFLSNHSNRSMSRNAHEMK